MVRGQNKTSARRKVFVRAVSGVRERYEERGPGKARCISGRPLAGVANGRKVDIRKNSKSQRVPSRPYAGVLSSPVMRELMRDQAHALDSAEKADSGDMYAVGRLCMKIAGRDAGQFCVIVDEKDGRFLVDGQTRRRAVSASHLEPTSQILKVKKGASHSDVVKALESAKIQVVESKSQKELASKQ